MNAASGSEPSAAPEGVSGEESPPDRAPRSARSRARFYAVQILFALEFTGGEAEAAVSEQLEGGPDGAPGHLDRSLYRAVALGAHKERESLDASLAPFLARRAGTRVPEPLLRCLLRAGAWELSHCGGTGTAVIVNEYMNLAHHFGLTPGAEVLNAVLDGFARQQRGGADRS